MTLESIAHKPQNLYVVGHPIAHSKSPVMYNAAYGAMGLPWTYGFADFPEEPDARAFLEFRDFLSVNITMPYKPLASKVATTLAASARLARGANVLVRKDDALIGYNTDGQGCVAYLEQRGVDFRGRSVVVCGTGPTSLSIFHAVVQAGPAQVILVGRDRAKAQKVLRSYADEYHRLANATIDLPAANDRHLSFKTALDSVGFKFGSYETSTRAIAEADIIIDATPLGMKESDPAPFDTALLSVGQTVFDVVYGHGETALLAAARKVGAAALDGEGMLVGQAVVTVRIVCDITGVPQTLDDGQLFSLMSEAAGFSCAE